MQTDKTTTESKQPLYKVLNEQRTQGQWGYGEYKGSESYKAHIIGDYSNEIAKFYWQTENNKSNNDKQSEANAQYTALAVNNLHHLAEALEKIAECEGEKLDAKDAAGFIKIAKEALNPIIVTGKQIGRAHV